MEISESLYQQIEGWIQPILEELSLKLVDLELVNENSNHILRVSIEKESGIGIDDCTKVSRQLSLILDVEEPFSFEFFLEVSSPGIYRVLKTEEDFSRFQGEQVKALLKLKIDRQKNLVGILKDSTESTVILDVKGTDKEIQRSNLSKIHLFPKF
ncbi:MAG: ribosome maturation factor RimP [bacterium]|jgi:ribosome maturation factor RimP